MRKLRQEEEMDEMQEGGGRRKHRTPLGSAWHSRGNHEHCRPARRSPYVQYGRLPGRYVPCNFNVRETLAEIAAYVIPPRNVHVWSFLSGSAGSRHNSYDNDIL